MVANKELFPISEIIKLASARGVDFGSGNPENRIRYYIRFGLLPHAKRKSFNGAAPTAAFRLDVVDRIVQIEKLQRKGKSVPEQKQLLLEVKTPKKLYKTTKTQTISERLEPSHPNNKWLNYSLAATVFVAILLLASLAANLVLVDPESNQVLGVQTKNENLVVKVGKALVWPIAKVNLALLKTLKNEQDIDPLDITNIQNDLEKNSDGILSASNLAIKDLQVERVSSREITFTNLGENCLLSLNSNKLLTCSDEFFDSAQIKAEIEKVTQETINALDLSTVSTVSTTNLTAFKYFAVSGQSTIAAGSSTDTVTFKAGSNITLTSDAGAKTIMINSTASGGGSGGDATTLDSLDSLQFLRADTADNFTSGTLTFDVGTILAVNGTFSCSDCVGDSAVANSITVAAAGITGTLTDGQVSDTLTIGVGGSVAASTITGSITDAQVSDTLTASNLVAVSSVVADGEVDDNLTIDGTGNVNWAALSSYPAACTAGTAITTLADSPTCTAFTRAGSTETITGAWSFDNLTIADTAVVFSSGNSGFDLQGGATTTLSIYNSTGGQVAGLAVEGVGAFGSYLATNSNLYVNYSGPDGNSYLYFYDAASPTSESISWNDASAQFEISDDLSVADNLFVLGGDIVGSNNTAMDIGEYVAGDITFGNVAALTNDYLVIRPYAAGAANFKGVFTSVDLTADRTWTFPDEGGTICTNTSVCSIYSPVAGSASITTVGVLTSGSIAAGFGTIATGNFIQGSELRSNGNIFVNYDGVDGNSFLYFYEGASTTGESLGWNDASAQFDLTDDLDVSGHGSFGSGASIDTNRILNINESKNFPSGGGTFYDAYISGDHDGADFNGGDTGAYNFYGLYIDHGVDSIELGYSNDNSVGIHVTTKTTATATLNSLIGVESDIADIGFGGTIDNIAAFKGYISDWDNAPSKIFWAANSAADATVTGLYIDDFTAAGSYGIYQAGTNDYNILGSSTRIGGTTNPTVALDVTGAILASSTITGSELRSNGNIHINYDGADATTYLYFYESSDPTGEYLRWLDSSAYFNLSDDLDIDNHAAIGTAASPTSTYALTISEDTTYDAAFRGGINVTTVGRTDNAMYGIYSLFEPFAFTANITAIQRGIYNDTVALGSSAGGPSAYTISEIRNFDSYVRSTTFPPLITNFSAYHITNPSIADPDGEITNFRGLMIEDITEGDITNKYPIYQAGETSQYNILKAATTLFGRDPSGNDTSYRTVIQGSLCVDDSTANCPATPTAGAIYVENSVGTGNVSAFDIAEYYPATEPVEKGDLVIAKGETKVGKSSSPYDETLIGVVSTDPAAVIDETNITFGKTAGDNFNPLKPYIALAGRVPTRVSTENGNIEPGDPLTSSSTPGVAMKATKSGPTVGKALESLTCDKAGPCQGKVMVFVLTGWYVHPLESELGSKLSNLTNISLDSLSTRTLLIGNNKIYLADNGDLKLDGSIEVAGDIKLTGEIFAKKLNVSDEATGSGTILSGQESIFIETSLVTDKSKVFLTLSTLTRQNIAVTKKETKRGFEVKITSPETVDVSFDWFVVN